MFQIRKQIIKREEEAVGSAHYLYCGGKLSPSFNTENGQKTMQNVGEMRQERKL